MSDVAVVARRILRSLEGDRRTLALVVVAPVAIVFLFSEVIPSAAGLAPEILGVFVFVLTYILTGIGFLRERQTGTLDRVLVSPISRTDLVLGYVAGYGLLSLVQSGVLLLAGIVFLDVAFAHGVLAFFVLELLGALTALGIGIVLSLFAENEFQVLQFLPAVVTPQILLGGVFSPVSALPVYLRYPAYVMPLTYLLRGMRYVVEGGSVHDFANAVAALAFTTLLAVLLASEVVRRQR